MARTNEIKVLVVDHVGEATINLDLGIALLWAHETRILLDEPESIVLASGGI